jgi:hypothetical protein
MLPREEALKAIIDVGVVAIYYPLKNITYLEIINC